MKNLLSISALVAAAFLSASVSIAGPPMGHSGPPFGQDPAIMIAHMSQRLDLSDDQQSQITTLLEAEQDQMQNNRDQLKSLREQLMSMEGDFDSDTARYITDEMGVLSGRLAYNRASTFSEINQILTEEQREKLSGFIEERGGRRGERHNKANRAR
ncbi:MAG: Spy/CpxP family protein refolding chaperone [Proteobacteria bacterium]|nr:Spy/CpxP family protein refolding chaperone [Pseudomonadota bacterium]